MKIGKITAFLCSAVMLMASLTACQSSSTAEPENSVNAVSNKNADEPTESRYALSNENADEQTRAIFDYVCDNFGENIISAQQESTWMGSPDYEMDYIFDKTGKYPAMRGLDYMNDDFKGVNERAVKWTEKGGLVTICWHTGYDFYGEWNESMKTEISDWNAVLTEGTEENKAFTQGMDKAAKALSELQDKGITVFWRPFHEFDGEWFWWGKGGSENFVKLWRMMYDRYTNHWKLNNLIWVLGYSGEVKKDWYPGDEYCDIIGADTYDGSTNQKAWKKLVETADKPLTFHECGAVPSVEKFESDNTLWAWFMIWHTDILTDNDTDNLKSVYNSERVITLDELPEELVKLTKNQ